MRSTSPMFGLRAALTDTAESASELSTASPGPAKTRLAWIDEAKGIGIILVVVGHVIQGLHASRIGLAEGPFHFLTHVIYSFHMPLFFFLAGLFTIPGIRKSEYGDFLLKRAGMILYPYFLWSVVQGVAAIVMAPYINAVEGPMTFRRLLMIPIAPIGQFWFLFVLFHCYWIYAVLSGSMRVRTVIAVALLAFAAAPFIPWVTVQQLSHNFLFFVAGAVIGAKRVCTLLPRSSAHFAVWGVIFIAAEMLTMAVNPSRYSPLWLFTAVPGVALVMGLTSLTARYSAFEFLRTLGLASLAIYTIHIMAYSAVRIGLTESGVYNVPMHLACGIVGGLAIPLAVWLISQKLGWTWLFRVGSQTHPVQADKESEDLKDAGLARR
jgi:fucose 4-O-acetylase-like acetyltransferase